MNRKFRLLLTFIVGLLVTVCLAQGHTNVGFARDEGVYFEASRSYGAWASQLLRDPGTALTQKSRDRAFRINREHPPAMKLAAGISANLFAFAPTTTNNDGEPSDSGGVFHLMRESVAMRLPAQILAGIGASLLFWLGSAQAGFLGGLLAFGWVYFLPRVAFHMGLHAFDGPAMVMSLIVATIYERSLSNRRFGLALGPTIAVAILVKHNAFFLVAICLAHYLVVFPWRKFSLRRFVSLPLCSLVIIGPALAVAGWPWLWTHPVSRLRAYFEFHLDHSYYNMAYLGENFNQPPMPVSYPWLMTWATVPTALLALSLIGIVVALTSSGRWSSPIATESTQARPLIVMLALAPIWVISLPTVPIFGGTKHWMTAYPFLALCAVIGWRWLWSQASAVIKSREKQYGSAVIAVVLLLPAVLATTSGHPYNLSQYAPLVGGPRGAAQLGLNRGFWGHAALPLLQDIDADEPVNLYLHDMHPLCEKQYRRDGTWPTEVHSSSLQESHRALYFPEMHMKSDEIKIWNRYRSTKPHTSLRIFGVPIGATYSE